MSNTKFDALAAWALPYLPKRFQEGRLPYLFFIVWLLIGDMVVLAFITPYPNGVPVPLAFAFVLLILQLLFIWGLPFSVAVHLGLLAGSRRRQVEQLKRFIQREIPGDEPLLVAGDFNRFDHVLVMDRANLAAWAKSGVKRLGVYDYLYGADVAALWKSFVGALPGFGLGLQLDRFRLCHGPGAAASACIQLKLPKSNERPCTTPSLPKPESLMPPKGASGTEMAKVLMPTMPLSTASPSKFA